MRNTDRYTGSQARRVPAAQAHGATWRPFPGSSRPTVDEVHTILKNMIHRGELQPDDRLPPERRLCGMLQVSRSTLREALNALRADGYVEVRRGAQGGTFVSHLTEPYARWLAWMRADGTRLQEIMNLRTAVECQIAWLAAARHAVKPIPGLASTLNDGGSAMGPREFRLADGRFHSLLADAADSPRLKALMIEARGELFVPASAALLDGPTIARSHAEHRAILRAVGQGDPSAAAESMRTHLASTLHDAASVIDRSSAT
jgi:GntR family transcriptional repressor for pyruvate dehydrogenase complex